jgi:hypothetical protein
MDFQITELGQILANLVFVPGHCVRSFLIVWETISTVFRLGVFLRSTQRILLVRLIPVKSQNSRVIPAYNNQSTTTREAGGLNLHRVHRTRFGQESMPTVNHRTDVLQV